MLNLPPEIFSKDESWQEKSLLQITDWKNTQHEQKLTFQNHCYVRVLSNFNHCSSRFHSECGCGHLCHGEHLHFLWEPLPETHKSILHYEDYERILEKTHKTPRWVGDPDRGSYFDAEGDHQKMIIYLDKFVFNWYQLPSARTLASGNGIKGFLGGLVGASWDQIIFLNLINSLEVKRQCIINLREYASIVRSDL